MRIKPGQGWRHVNGSVWEHRNGVSIHLMGLIHLPHGKTIFVMNHPIVWEWDKLNRRIGGSRKRALMVLAIEYYEKFYIGEIVDEVYERVCKNKLPIDTWYNP